MATITIPMALLTVEVNSSNAFWTAKSGTNLDDGHVRFIDGAHGVATYWMIVPANVAATEAWNLDMYHHADAGLGSGDVVVSLNALALSDTSVVDGTTVNLISNSAYAADTAFTITRVNGSTFDGTLALSANTYLRIIVSRSGGHSSDTVGDPWNLNSLNWVGDIE